MLGCLVEKQRTTPDQYPLTLNALRLACNQSTNREPVVDYDEATVREAARGLAAREWARLASGAGSRAVKYRHLLDRALGLSDAELSLLAVLMLRGPQTPGELKQRSDRLHAFASLAAVEETIAGLLERELVGRLPAGPVRRRIASSSSSAGRSNRRTARLGHRLRPARSACGPTSCTKTARARSSGSSAPSASARSTARPGRQAGCTPSWRSSVAAPSTSDSHRRTIAAPRGSVARHSSSFWSTTLTPTTRERSLRVPRSSRS